MGGLVIETVRPGVQFVPEAAAAFRRANTQVRAEFGRDISVNSTYRAWDTQLAMYNAWNRYVAGLGPYPGHSKAVHPRESFHVSGTAVDSNDWVNDRIVTILADNGFIRNRLHVPNERHHFEYLRAQDKNYGTPTSGGGSVEDDMYTDEDRKRDEQTAKDVAWLMRRIGGRDSDQSLTSAVNGVAGMGQWLKDRIGGSTKTAQPVATELRNLRKDG